MTLDNIVRKCDLDIILIKQLVCLYRCLKRVKETFKLGKGDKRGYCCLSYCEKNVNVYWRIYVTKMFYIS